MNKAIVIFVYGLSLALLMSLSVWQLQRGLQKQEVERTMTLSQEILSINDLALIDDHLLYKKVLVSGRLLHQFSFTLSNRRHDNQTGVEVFTPLALENGQALMVNRGWQSEDESRRLSIDENTKPVQLSGVIYKPSKGVRVGESILPEENWPKSSLYLDLASFSDHIGQALSAYVLVLDQSDEHAFTQIWKATSMSSQKHFGYAVQWLGLAITWVIFGFIWLRKKR